MRLLQELQRGVSSRNLTEAEGRLQAAITDSGVSIMIASLTSSSVCVCRLWPKYLESTSCSQQKRSSCTIAGALPHRRKSLVVTLTRDNYSQPPTRFRFWVVIVAYFDSLLRAANGHRFALRSALRSGSCLRSRPSKVRKSTADGSFAACRFCATCSTLKTA